MRSWVNGITCTWRAARIMQAMCMAIQVNPMNTWRGIANFTRNQVTNHRNLMNRTIFLGILTIVLVSSLVRAQPAAPTTVPLSQQDPTVAAVKTGANGPKFLEMHQ